MNGLNYNLPFQFLVGRGVGCKVNIFFTIFPDNIYCQVQSNRNEILKVKANSYISVHRIKKLGNKNLPTNWISSECYLFISL